MFKYFMYYYYNMAGDGTKTEFTIPKDSTDTFVNLIEISKMPGATVTIDPKTGEGTIKIDPERAKNEPLPKLK